VQQLLRDRHAVGKRHLPKQLLQTKDRIIDIAGNVGFENSKYFSQVFKKRTGMTPQEYRAAMQKEAEL